MKIMDRHVMPRQPAYSRCGGRVGVHLDHYSQPFGVKSNCISRALSPVHRDIEFSRMKRPGIASVHQILTRCHGEGYFGREPHCTIAQWNS